MQTKEINQLKEEIRSILINNKAKEVETINLKGKTSIADFMIIASGSTSDTDGGIIVQISATAGYAMGYDSGVDRLLRSSRTN